MIAKKDIEQVISTNDNVQVVLKTLNMTPLTGKMHEMLDSSIWLVPYTDKKLIEDYGEPVTTDTLIPYEELLLIFKLTGNASKKEKENNESN
jgi:hypothetical protein